MKFNVFLYHVAPAAEAVLVLGGCHVYWRMAGLTKQLRSELLVLLHLWMAARRSRRWPRRPLTWFSASSTRMRPKRRTSKYFCGSGTVSGAAVDVADAKDAKAAGVAYVATTARSAIVQVAGDTTVAANECRKAADDSVADAAGCGADAVSE